MGRDCDRQAGRRHDTYSPPAPQRGAGERPDAARAQSAVLGAASWGWQGLTAASRQAASEALPALTTYIAAAALLMSALGMWWWADCRFTL